MSSQKSNTYKIALLGNPNSGKSTLFNTFTGLRQRISNYPGVTVDKKSGSLSLPLGRRVELIDFPGIYSLYPNSSDERIVVEMLTNPSGNNYPDAIIYVAAAVELEKHFLLATQLKELGIPMIFCMTMQDISMAKGISYDTEKLQKYLECPVIEISAVKNVNLDQLKSELDDLLQDLSVDKWKNTRPFSKIEKEISSLTQAITGLENPYQNLLIGHHCRWLSHLENEKKQELENQLSQLNYNSLGLQVEETLNRYDAFTNIIESAQTNSEPQTNSLTDKVDAVITHRLFGPVIFIGIMLLVFQAIYAWSEWPMTLIENGFAAMTSTVRSILPKGWFTDLLADGVIAGLGGVVIFIPQITILFLLLALLEESGYMSRAVYMFDGLMQRFGLNGRSIVALVSSGACAIPAIMSTRTIANWKERIITIMVAPLISCSARLPVYAILIGFVVPATTVWGIFNAQGLAFMGLYLLGIVAALVSALIFKMLLPSKGSSFLAMELPQYKTPRFKNVLFYLKEKVLAFIIGAGQVILVISIILWFLASYGPGSKMQLAETKAITIAKESGLDQSQTDNLIASRRLEASFAGHIGKFIEPAITPLGYDWKIGIALITSFAAREVFVGTMATIYSVGSSNDEATIREHMAAERHPITGGPRYNMPTALSLLLFYVFAMQCMSTLAVVKRETKSWKWPLVQFGFMSVLAYVSALIVYQVFV